MTDFYNRQTQDVNNVIVQWYEFIKSVQKQLYLQNQNTNSQAWISLKFCGTNRQIQEAWFGARGGSTRGGVWGRGMSPPQKKMNFPLK